VKGPSFKAYLLTGLVVWLPILVTMGVLRFIIDLLDKTMALIPKAYQPEQLLGYHIPGLGVVLSLLLLLLTGMLATNFFGQRLVRWGEAVLAKIPLVRSIYNAVKQVMNAILSSNSQAFRRVLLIEYPSAGIWSLAFQTGSASLAINTLAGEELVSAFVPTTPNPTSGFLMMVPKSKVKDLDMSVDEALKLIISLGVMQPETITKKPIKKTLKK
jgi:uncharacterized membrane protein